MLLLSVKDLSEQTKLSTSMWRSLMRRGRLPVVRIGRAVRVDERAFQEFIKQHSIAERAS